ncbi:hypothetical protein AX15_007033 [Amanita polypyramis BW_CC]|nr:hypothetical protein AX15_007033 [Amanita polypyramis BW_CC]
MWLNQQLICKDRKRVAAHSSFDAELQAINLAFMQLPSFNHPQVTILSDNESAAKSIWNTDFHNLQMISISVMTNFRTWVSKMNPSQVNFTVSWYPAHMDINENEFVDSLTTEYLPEPVIQFSMLQLKINEVTESEFGVWNSVMKKHNTLGHGYLRLKFKGKHIGPTTGTRRNAFILASKDNIKMMARLTQIITNHAPTGEYCRRFFPTEVTECQFNGQFHSCTHILTQGQCYDKKF